MNADHLERHIQRRFRVRHMHVTEKDGYPFLAPRGGRERLAEVFAEAGFTRGVEVGTLEGHFAMRLCQANPNLELTCVDPWAAYGRANQQRMDLHYRRAQRNLAGLKVRILRKPSLQALADFADESLDFAYVDGDHQFDMAMCDIILWNRKVRTGGIMSGHDYFAHPSVTRAVEAYVHNHDNIGPWYALREASGGTFLWVVRR